jgi:glycosyltransferase involved in cell wall biosynthesis
MYRQAAKRQLDVYHGLSHELPLSVKKIGCPAVVTMHDLIYKRFPKYFGLWDRKVYDMKWRWSVHAADHIIAISQATADDIIHYFNVPARKITVLYNCVSASFHPVKSDEEDLKKLDPHWPTEPYALFLGQNNKRKNLDLLLRTYEKFADQLPPLVVIGAGRNIGLPSGLAQERIYTPQGRFTEQELAIIMRQARMLVYPSRFEGFGLPVLEAMQSGTPVITCANSSLPEVGGNAVLYTDEDDARQLLEHMTQLVQDDQLHKDLRHAGLERSKQFSRARHAQNLLALYNQITP